ncbi:MAG: ion channel [Algibacter sp.]
MGKKIKDPGLGNASAQYASRMMNTKGSFNVVHLNAPRRFSEAYNYLVSITWWHFYALSFCTYFIANACFAIVYLIVGIEQVIASTGNLFNDFLNAFFFSSQTFTTLGYGAMSPNGVASGIVSSIEAFVGLMFFAFVTGLLYGRFSKPKASIRFSENLILRDFNHTKAIMFRLVNNRKSTMINPRVSVTLALSKQNNVGDFVNNFYALNLERKSITYLPTTWTVVHEIEEDSPLFEFSNEEIRQQHGELLVMISYYDESFNQEVHQMHSYMLSDIHLNYKFTKSYFYNNKGQMVLDHKLFDRIEPLKS